MKTGATLQTPCRPPFRPDSDPHADLPTDPTDPHADPLHTQTPYPIGVRAPSDGAHANALKARSDDAPGRKVGDRKGERWPESSRRARGGIPQKQPQNPLAKARNDGGACFRLHYLENIDFSGNTASHPSFSPPMERPR